MSGFHILLVKLKVLHKKYNLLGLQQWWLKSKIIAVGSVNQAAEGKHYSRAIRLHKQSLECLLRFQSEKIIADLPVDVMKKVKNIRLHPSPDSLNDLLSTSQWKEIKKNLLNTSGTMGKWILQYITDVGELLSQIIAYREKNKESHLQAQRDLLPLLFAFNHQNYSRYLTTHHVELTNLPSKNPSAYKDLQTYGIGASLSGKKFFHNTRRFSNRGHNQQGSKSTRRTNERRI